MDNAKKHYWGICQGKTVLFAGSHKQCWQNLVETYGKFTVTELETMRISISRIN